MPIFFDIDDTLLDERGAQEVYLRHCFELWRDRLPHDHLSFRSAWHSSAVRHFERWLQGEITHQDQRRARVRDVFQRPDMSDAEADARVREFADVYETSWSLFEDVLPTLDALRGEVLGVITNGTDAQQIAKLERMGIADRFALILTSEAAGAAKPSPAIFHAAAARLDCAVGDCVHVGDDVVRDILGASAAGVRPVWLHRGPGTGVTHPRVTEPPDGVATIGSLLELPALLELGRPST